MSDPFNFDKVRTRQEDTYSELLMALREIEFHTSRVYGWTMVHRFEEAHADALKMAQSARKIVRTLRLMNKLMSMEEFTKQQKTPTADATH